MLRCWPEVGRRSLTCRADRRRTGTGGLRGDVGPVGAELRAEECASGSNRLGAPLAPVFAAAVAADVEVATAGTGLSGAQARTDQRCTEHNHRHQLLWHRFAPRLAVHAGAACLVRSVGQATAAVCLRNIRCADGTIPLPS